MLSIITPVLNGGKFIEDNILSIKELGVPFEHIVIDGGSTDSTIDIVSKYSHVKLFQEQGAEGMYSAIDQGIKLSSGSYIAYVNADDKVVRKGYEAMYGAIISEDADVVYSDADMFYSETNYTRKVNGRRFGKYFLKNGIFPFVQPSSIFTKKIYTAVDGFNFKNFKISGDMDFFYRIAKLEESKFKYIPVKSSVFLKHGNSLGDRSTEEANRERQRANIPNPTIIHRILFGILKYF